MPEPTLTPITPAVTRGPDPLAPIDPDRAPVASEGAEFVVASHALGRWQRGDRVSRKDLGVSEDRVGELVGLGGLYPLPPEPKAEPAPSKPPKTPKE